MFVKAQVSRGNRWKIDYKIFFDDHEDRIRQEFGLNSIADVTVREHVATAICTFLETFDFSKLLPQVAAPGVPTLLEKLVEVRTSKEQYDRGNTADTYKSTINQFITWAKKHGFAALPFTAFTKDNAKQFTESLKRRKLAPRTRNNYLTQLRTVFNEFDQDNPLYVNPFDGIKKERVLGKNRRTFTADERRIVAEYIERTDYWLFRALLLQFYCYVRPAEMNRLKFKAFNLSAGLITVEAYEAKCWKERTVTIPEAVLPYFVDGVFDRQPLNWYVFGRVGNGSRREGDRMGPSATPSRDDRAYKKHRAILVRLQQKGLLSDIAGLTWYSWKDSGITLHADHTTPLATKNQAGHAKFDQTLAYYHKSTVNKEYKALKADLFD